MDSRGSKKYIILFISNEFKKSNVLPLLLLLPLKSKWDLRIKKDKSFWPVKSLLNTIKIISPMLSKWRLCRSGHYRLFPVLKKKRAQRGKYSISLLKHQQRAAKEKGEWKIFTVNLLTTTYKKKAGGILLHDLFRLYQIKIRISYYYCKNNETLISSCEIL